jgi:hypothetical protein
LPQQQAEIRQRQFDVPNETVKVDGVEKDAAIETGANCSVISPETAKKLDIPYKKTDAGIILGDGSIATPLGETGKVNVRIRNVQYSINLMVMEMNEYEILLGNDWLVPTGAYVHPQGNRVMFEHYSLALVACFYDFHRV